MGEEKVFSHSYGKLWKVRYMFKGLRALGGSLCVALMVMVTAMVLSGTLQGQAADGNLTGVILDPSGAAVVNATVGAENLATGFKTSSTTDLIGTYRFQNLSIGNYKLTAGAVGFQTTTLASVAVELSKTTTAHVTLTVGQQTDSITVTDTPSLIDTTTAQIANLFTTRMSSDLPGRPILREAISISLYWGLAWPVPEVWVPEPDRPLAVNGPGTIISPSKVLTTTARTSRAPLFRCQMTQCGSSQCYKTSSAPNTATPPGDSLMR